MTSEEMTQALAEAWATRDTAKRVKIFGELLRLNGIKPSEVAGFVSAHKVIKQAIRLRCAEEKGIKVGVVVAFGKKSGEVTSVTGRGLQVRGFRGTFNPLSVVVV